MFKSSAVRTIFVTWLGWFAVMLLFMHFVGDRIEPKLPDRVLEWTASSTGAQSNRDYPYLNDPYLNEQVAWDSEYYLSIALAGYEDAEVRGTGNEKGLGTPLSYAFFPLYPMLIRLTLPLWGLFGLSGIPAATLGGVLISGLGALAAALSLYELVRHALGDDGGLRAVFYLLVFPSSFFLATVYTEGVFLGLSFGTLAMLQRRKWWAAGLLGALAVWARPGGALLVIPLGVIWFSKVLWQGDWKQTLLKGLAVLAPVLSYIAWSLTPLAETFHQVEAEYFGRGLLNINGFLAGLQRVALIQSGNRASLVYFFLEAASTLLALAACFYLIRQRPELAWYGLAVVLFSLTSGATQGMIRYVLAAPPLFWLLARLGKNSSFDRVWSLLSILLLGLEAMLFAFNMWVA